MDIRRGRSFTDNSFRTPVKRPVVGVMGGSRMQNQDLVLELGTWLGTTGYDLLTGAGKGTMALVSRVFSEQPGRGLIIGVVPGMMDPADVRYRTRSKHYPNQWVEVAIFTHLPTTDDLYGLGSRNPINVLTSDVVVVLPGGDGTGAELQLAVQLRKPVVVYLGSDGEIDGRTAPSLADDYGDDVAFAAELSEVVAFVSQTMTDLGYAAPKGAG